MTHPSQFKLTPTISTCVAFFDGEVDYKALFYILPCSKFDVTVTKRGKMNLSKTGDPGTIVSIRMEHEKENYFRGFLPSKNPFKNVLTIDVYDDEKLVNAKLSKTKVKMCGTRDKESCEETVNIILNKIHQGKAMLKVLRETSGTIEYIEKIMGNSSGTSLNRLLPKQGKSKKQETIDDKKVVIYLEKPSNPAEQFINDLIEDSSFVYHSDLIKYLNGLKGVIESREEISTLQYRAPSSIKTAMSNYNYNINRKITRKELIRKFADRVGWGVVYDPDSTISTKIELPYIPDSTTGTERKKNVPCHVFLVYSSGSVTQSGPGGPSVEMAFRAFIEILGVEAISKN